MNTLDFVMARLFEISPPAKGGGALSPEEIAVRAVAAHQELKTILQDMIDLFDDGPEYNVIKRARAALSKGPM